MAIFISYSHGDKGFVDRLATELVLKRIHVFVDRWEMNVGDSITAKIEKAITDASFLIVVLSKKSVESNWCKREITSGLLLELERKRVVVLPVLIEDCDIPLFLRDKMYADFRKNFNEGLDQILTSVAKLNKEESGRLEANDWYYTDFATNWGKRGEYFEFTIDVVEFSIAPDAPYTILINIVVIGNKAATERYDIHAKIGKPWLMKNMILMLFAESEELTSMNAHLLKDQIFTTEFSIKESKTDISFRAFVTIKRLGITDGKDKLYYFGKIFNLLWEDAKVEMKNM
jgi:hypothetical protein